MYKATASCRGGRGGRRGAGRRGCQPQDKKPGEGEVIDAEYVDVDESKKPN